MEIKTFTLSIAVCSLMLCINPLSIKRVYATDLINSRSELMNAISYAHDGDILYIDDIDFTSHTDGEYNLYERVDIRKSITIRGKDSGSLLTRGSFNVIGGKTYNDLLNVRFENINFKLYDNNKGLTSSDWDDIAKSQYATYFSGNVNVSFFNCSFKGYMNYEGGAMFGMYGDYSQFDYYLEKYGDQTSCKLNVDIENCSFIDNASSHGGGALYFEGYEDNIAVDIKSSSFKENIAGLVGYSGRGGGAIYGSDIKLTASDSTFDSNIANYIYSGNEATGDSTNGGAIALYNSELELNNVIVSNNVASYGGGLYLGNTNGKIISTLINNNKADRASEEEIYQGKYANTELGGAMYFVGSGHSLNILNSQIINNLSNNVYSGIAYPVIFTDNDVSNIKIYYSIYANKPSLADTFAFDFDPPDDVLAYRSFDIKASLILDEIYEEAFPRNEIPSIDNGFNLLSSITKGKNEGIIKEDNNGDYKVDESKLSSYVVPKEILNDIFGEKANLFNNVSLGTSFSKKVNINIHDKGEVIDTISAHFLDEIVLTPREGNLFNSFVNYVDDSHNVYEDKIIIINQSDINLYAQYEKTGAFYFLAVGLPLIVMGVIGISVLIFIILYRKKIRNSKKESIVFSDKNIEKFISVYSDVLTDKEKEITTMILKGKKRDEIANESFISKSTVKTHINHIYSKLNVLSREDFLNLVRETIK